MKCARADSTPPAPRRVGRSSSTRTRPARRRVPTSRSIRPATSSSSGTSGRTRTPGGARRTASNLGVFARRFEREREPAVRRVPGQSVHHGLPVAGRRVAMRPTGEFIVVWTSPQDDQLGTIMARRYDERRAVRSGASSRSTRGELGGRSISPTWRSIRPERRSSSGRSYGQDGGGAGVYAQRLDAAGNKLGPEFNVNTYTTGAQLRARVAAPAITGTDPGEFAIIWQGPRDRTVATSPSAPSTSLQTGGRDGFAARQQLHIGTPGDRLHRGAAQRAVRRGMAERRQRRLEPRHRGAPGRRSARGKHGRRPTADGAQEGNSNLNGVLEVSKGSLCRSASATGLRTPSP